MSYNNYRLLDIKYNTLGKARKERLQDLKRLRQNQREFKDRNLKVRYQFSPTNPFELTLIGYDGGAKYTSTKMSQAELNRIYRIIDQMPMRQAELRRQAGGNMELFTNANPKTTLKGTGFKDAKKARETLKLIQNRPKIYQFQVVNTMYNRAKYHPNQTKEMKEAMKIYAKWLSNYKSKK